MLKKKKKKSFFDIKKRNIFKKKKKTITFSLSELVLMSILSIFFGLLVGLVISYTKIIYFNSSNKGLNEIVSTYNGIVNSYEGDLDKDKVVNGAIEGMINSLEDPYSNYMDKELTEEFDQSVDGYYMGIGAAVSYVDGDCTITDVYANSPAKKAGVKKGDVFVKIDDTNVEDYALEEITKMIKNSKKIKLTVRRNGKLKTFDIKIGKVEFESVNTVLYDDVGYIKIDSFASNTSKQFRDKLEKLEKKNFKSLIIDVRNNPGGHLNQADSILDMFFKRKTVLYQIKDKKNTTKVYAKTKESRDYPVVILTDGGTASAAEILASCFKDNYKKVVLVGETTYGKGTIQKDIRLKNGSSIKYTTDKWLTSKGVWLDRDTTGGLKPDVEFVDTNYKQIEKAIEEAKKSR